MTYLIRLFVAAFAFFSVSTAFAHDYTLGNIQINHPWARATVEGIPNGAAYLGLENSGDADDRLLGASTPKAETVELHTHIRDGEVMRMRQVEDIVIPAGSGVKLEPGGLHIMLMDLNEPLQDGEMFPMTLEFANAGTVTVDVLVQLMTGGGHDHSNH